MNKTSGWLVLVDGSQASAGCRRDVDMVEFALPLGRCQSGRLGPPAKRLPGHKTSAAGSNPVLPADCFLVIAEILEYRDTCQSWNLKIEDPRL